MNEEWTNKITCVGYTKMHSKVNQPHSRIMTVEKNCLTIKCTEIFQCHSSKVKQAQFKEYAEVDNTFAVLCSHGMENKLRTDKDFNLDLTNVIEGSRNLRADIVIKNLNCRS